MTVLLVTIEEKLDGTYHKEEHKGKMVVDIRNLRDETITEKEKNFASLLEPVITELSKSLLDGVEQIYSKRWEDHK